MCGIAGFLDPKNILDDTTANTVLKAMTSALVHRGPDDEGTYFNRDSGIALGHRRLAIVDLSAAGHQPMHSASGRFVVVFNGEIYNFKELRDRLKALGNSFKGASDTEVLLAAVEQWGVNQALSEFEGMFAFALWDIEQRKLVLARDRFGEKPLYYGWQGGCFLFASELKAFKVHPCFRGEISREQVQNYLQLSFVPGPASLYENIFKLEPGCFIEVETAPKMTSYWSAEKEAKAAFAEKSNFGGDLEMASRQLENLLSSTIHGQMIADVPLGAFLSGGIDSSLIVALMQKQSARPVKTFTVGFREDGFDEAAKARAVAKHLGTEHNELYVDSNQARDVIPELAHFYDEPFADPSQIPTFLIARLTRSQVTVALSGDGGDELFGGYNRYLWANRIWNRMKFVPRPLRVLMSKAMQNTPAFVYDSLPGASALRTEKLYKLARILKAREPREIYLSLLAQTESSTPTTLPRLIANNGLDFVSWMQLMDTHSYLCDDILVKVDRAAMGVSLETRAPFLNHRVFEFSWRLPMQMKIQNGQGKLILRKILERYVPRALTDRPKSGFSVPIGDWLRGGLREWAEHLLSEARIKREGHLDANVIRRKWRNHLAGNSGHATELWGVLMFQAWLESNSR